MLRGGIGFGVCCDRRSPLTQTLRYESREARDMVFKSPMPQGLAAGYGRLAKVLGASAG